MWALILYTYAAGTGGHLAISSVAPMASQAECEKWRAVLVRDLPPDKKELFGCYDVTKLGLK